MKKLFLIFLTFISLDLFAQLTAPSFTQVGDWKGNFRPKGYKKVGTCLKSVGCTFFSNNDTGFYATSEQVFRTIDSGATWQLLKIPTIINSQKYYFNRNREIYVGIGDIKSIKVFGRNVVAYACSGNDKYAVSIDGGNSWTQMSYDTLNKEAPVNVANLELIYDTFSKTFVTNIYFANLADGPGNYYATSYYEAKTLNEIKKNNFNMSYSSANPCGKTMYISSTTQVEFKYNSFQPGLSSNPKPFDVSITINGFLSLTNDCNINISSLNPDYSRLTTVNLVARKSNDVILILSDGRGTYFLKCSQLTNIKNPNFNTYKSTYLFRATDVQWLGGLNWIALGNDNKIYKSNDDATTWTFINKLQKDASLSFSPDLTRNIIAITPNR